jgi:hypothetical protein
MKEFLVNRVIDFAAWRAEHGEYRLTPVGRKRYKELIDEIKKKNPISLTDYMGILDGYDYNSDIQGLENLEQLNLNKGCMILANHERKLPISGGSIIFPIGFHLKNATDKEIRWVYGTDISPNQLAKGNLEKSCNFILVRGKNSFGFQETQIKGMRELLQATRHDLVGLFPEGDDGEMLLRAQWRAGRLITNVARNGTPIICASTSIHDRNVFRVEFQKLDNMRISNMYDEMVHHSGSRVAAGQIVADYAMATIATGQPEEKQGCYKNPERFLDML